MHHNSCVCLWLQTNKCPPSQEHLRVPLKDLTHPQSAKHTITWWEWDASLSLPDIVFIIPLLISGLLLPVVTLAVKGKRIKKKHFLLKTVSLHLFWRCCRIFWKQKQNIPRIFRASWQSICDHCITLTSMWHWFRTCCLTGTNTALLFELLCFLYFTQYFVKCLNLCWIFL